MIRKYQRLIYTVQHYRMPLIFYAFHVVISTASFRHCWSVHIRHDTDILPQSTCREGVMLVYNRNPDFIITLTWKIKKCIITQAFQINTVKQNVTYSKIVYMNQHTTTTHYISNNINICFDWESQIKFHILRDKPTNASSSMEVKVIKEPISDQFNI